ncbi:MAG TPA: M24 family metallopeptidase, partial [Nitrolancea sp.]|nr:M24 family metallopeptidase [Nitrolancea sp.]
ALVNGYCADLTRTIWLGEPEAKLQEVYRIVLDALRTAEASIRPGMTGKEADAAARDIIVAAGYGEAFGHSLGHGLGVRVHEGPSLSVRSEERLEPGNVVTIEPGIYLPSWGGVRIEDVAVIEENGLRVLTGAPKLSIESTTEGT